MKQRSTVDSCEDGSSDEGPPSRRKASLKEKKASRTSKASSRSVLGKSRAKFRVRVTATRQKKRVKH